MRGLFFSLLSFNNPSSMPRLLVTRTECPYSDVARCATVSWKPELKGELRTEKTCTADDNCTWDAGACQWNAEEDDFHIMCKQEGDSEKVVVSSVQRGGKEIYIGDDNPQCRTAAEQVCLIMAKTGFGLPLAFATDDLGNLDKPLPSSMCHVAGMDPSMMSKTGSCLHFDKNSDGHYTYELTTKGKDSSGVNVMDTAAWNEGPAARSSRLKDKGYQRTLEDLETYLGGLNQRWGDLFDKCYYAPP
jgi:hypothetical protein